MAGAKLPPRQKMIGLMYLVLLALLAMNVSKSILDSFVVINDGIENTTTTFDASNALLYDAFDRAAQESPAAKAWQVKADKVRKSANELYEHIQKLKKALYKGADGISESVADTIPMGHINGKDNTEVPTRLMGIADPAKPGSSIECEECSSTLLREKLNAFHKGLLAVFDDKNVKDDIEKKIVFLETHEVHSHGGDKDVWEVGMFYGTPLAAVVTTLSKIQSDVRTAEAQVINRLYENIDAGGVSFNKVEGMAVLPKAYILDGDSFAARIFTVASDDRVDPEVFVFTQNGGIDSAALNKGETDIDKLMKGTKGTKWGEGDWYPMTKEDIIAGEGKLKIKEGVGVHNWGGIIKIKTKKGPKVYPFTSSFEVGKPSTTIAATAMNVFYAGIDNPISVSAPMPNFKASGPGMRAGKGAGQYVIKPRKSGDVTINVVGTDENGKTVQLGKQKFRVKRIPTPVAYIGGKTGTVKLTKSKLGNGVINAKMEGFVFDLRVKVKSFTLGTTVNGDYKAVKVTGNRMNASCKALIKKASRGQRFYLEEMQVKMPDGRTVKLGNVTVKIG